MDIWQSIVERFVLNFVSNNVTPEAVAAFVEKIKAQLEAAVAKTPVTWDDKALAALEEAVKGGDSMKAIEGVVLSLAAAAAQGNQFATDVVATIKKALGV